MRGMYIVWLREHVLARVRVYKVGRTGDIWERLKKYPKGSLLVFFSEWNEEEPVGLEPLEAVVLALLRGSAQVKQRRDLGTEYFEGDMRGMASLILEMQKRLSTAPGGGGETLPEVVEEEVAADASDSPPGASDASEEAQDASGAPVGGADGAPSHAPVTLTFDGAIKGFLKAREPQLAGATVSLSELFLQFCAYAAAASPPMSCAHPTPHAFMRKLASLSGATGVTAREGLVEERHVRFPALQAPSAGDAVGRFAAESVRRLQGGAFTLKQAKEAFKASKHFDGNVIQLKTGLESALGTACLAQKWLGGMRTQAVDVFDGYVLDGQGSLPAEEFARAHIVRREGAWFTLGDARRRFVESNPKNAGRAGTLKSDLARALSTQCHSQKWIEGANRRNAFVGFHLVQQEAASGGSDADARLD